MKALKSQLLFELSDIKKLDTVFIGGGTPSCVDASLYNDIFNIIRAYIDINTEITTEANPNSATKEWLEKMFALGVNRVSFGVQSFNDKKLKLLNRAHNSSQAKEAIINAHKVGFKNISLDLIYAFLGDTKDLLKNDLNIAFSLPINHLSAYALTIEEGTVFEKKPHLSNEKLSLSRWFFKEIEKNGFKQYEISNFGSYQSRHNKGYWRLEEYIGVGAGAVGMKNETRYYPHKNIEEYIKNPLYKENESLNSENIIFEKIFLGFRSNIGVKTKILNNNQLKKAMLLVDEKKIELINDTFYNKDFLLADEIALFIS